MHITGLYTAIAALLVIVLSLRVVLARRSYGVTLGNGEDKELIKRIRAHGNATEYLPLALLLLFALEWNQTRPEFLHAFGIALIVARVAHAIGLSTTGGVSAGRFVGTGLTWLVMLVMALLLVWQWVVLMR